MRDKRLTFLVPIQTRDSAGALATSYRDHVTVWGSIGPLSGRELYAAKQIIAEATFLAETQFLAGITTSMRIRYGSRVFDILHVADPGEAHRDLRLLCSEVMR